MYILGMLQPMSHCTKYIPEDKLAAKLREILKQPYIKCGEYLQRKLQFTKTLHVLQIMAAMYHASNHRHSGTHN